MKKYPSILTIKEAGFPKITNCIAFDKIDGSNLRFEYNKKQWNKFGTRHHLFDETDDVFGVAIDIFRNKWQDDITKILLKERISQCIVFMEFYGENSFAGVHVPEDKKHLKFFDINIYKKGLMPSREFLKLFGHLDIPEVIYEGNLNKQFVLDVENGLYNINEGVVCKGGNKQNNMWMRKIKTIEYLNKLKGDLNEN